jgi:hypothetical protein
MGLLVFSVHVDSNSGPALSSLHPDVLNALKYKLRLDRQEIMKRYGSYVQYIRKSIINQGVTAETLSTFLMGLFAFNHREQQDVLLSGSKLEEAVEVNFIFRLLIKEYSSFLNYGIFQIIQEEYVADEGQRELQYPSHLKEYIKKHNVAEFTNPALEKHTDSSQIMTVKFDIPETCKLARLDNLKNEIAKILKITPLGLQLIDVEKGCVKVTFLVANSIANVIFTGDQHEIFSPQEKDEFQALSIQWLKCKGYEWNFAAEVGHEQSKIPG